MGLTSRYLSFLWNPAILRDRHPKKRDRLWKPDVLSQLPREGKRDKTRTERKENAPLGIFSDGPACRAAESSDREVGRSECCTVMVQIAVEILLQAKAKLTFNRCIMAKYFTEPMN